MDNEQLYSSISKLYAGGEPIQIAGMVYWNVIITEAKPGGLANQGMTAKDLAWGVAFGAGGVLLGRMFDKSTPAGCTCQLGILAVGNHRVFLLELGRIPMLGRSKHDAKLPEKLLDNIPQQFQTNKVLAFRPAKVMTNVDILRIDVLGKPPAKSDSAFESEGSCLVVCAPGQDREAPSVRVADSIANVIRKFATHYPSPNEVIDSILAMESIPLDLNVENACSDLDYVQVFSPVYRKQRMVVRRALISISSRGPSSLRAMMDKCLQQRAGIASFELKVSLFFFVFGILCYFLFCQSFSKDSQFQSIGSMLLISAILPISLVLGIVGLSTVWRSNITDYWLERGLFEKGSEFDGALDTFLALLALDRAWQKRVDWKEVEDEFLSNPRFNSVLCEILRELKENELSRVLASAPASLKMKLAQTLLKYRGGASSVCYFTIWLPCLALGIHVIVQGFDSNPPTASDWFLLVFGIFIGFGGLIPAILLFFKLIKSRRRIRRAFQSLTIS